MSELKLTPEVLAAVDALYWTLFNKIKLQSGLYSLEGREYQKEPMMSTHRRICYMKATQGGITEIEVLKSLWGMINHYYPRGVLYLFPTADDVSDFSKSRFNPLIYANKQSIGRFVKPGGKGTDTTGLKKIHEAFLYLRGARLSQSIGVDEKESSKLRSIPVDCVKFDELDLMDMGMVAKALGRMGDSELKHEVYISNPTLPDFGIDSIFAKSDQRHLFRLCECGAWTCAELEFPECVAIRQDGTGYIKCNKCGLQIGMRQNEWVPAERENSNYMHGYQWSQLSSPNNDPAEILADFNDPPNGNLGDVYRLKLGLPYVAAEDRLTEDVVLGRCSNDVSPSGTTEQTAMGVDVGKVKHIVIGTRTGKESFRILKAIKLSSWSDIHDLAQRFNVKSAVIDIRPYEDSVRQFQKEEQYKMFLCEYTESSITGPSYDEKHGTVKVNRTEVCDATHRLFAKDQIVLPRRNTEITDFAKQCSNIAKVLEDNKRTGTSIYRYRKVGSGGDHYRHALNYFYLAASQSRIRRSSTTYGPRQLQAVNSFM